MKYIICTAYSIILSRHITGNIGTISLGTSMDRMLVSTSCLLLRISLSPTLITVLARYYMTTDVQGKQWYKPTRNIM